MYPDLADEGSEVFASEARIARTLMRRVSKTRVTPCVGPGLSRLKVTTRSFVVAGGGPCRCRAPREFEIPYLGRC